MAVAMRITAPAAQEDAPSQLFKDYLAARAAFLGVFTPGHVEDAAWLKREERAGRAHVSAIEAICNRTPTSARELVELANVALLENENTWDHSNTFAMEPPLVWAIISLFGEAAA